MIIAKDIILVHHSHHFIDASLNMPASTDNGCPVWRSICTIDK